MTACIFSFRKFTKMDLTKLANKTTKSTSGGAGSNLRIAFKKDLDIIPEPSAGNKAIIEDDFVFKAGKTWVDIFVDDKKNQLVEEANEMRFNNGYTGTLTAFAPGDNDYLRQFINESYVIEEAYVLIDSCKDKSTTLIGKGECSPVTIKINYDSGASSADEKGFVMTFAIDQEGVSCVYQGVGAKIQTYIVAVDDATPDVSTGTGRYLLPENTTLLTEITALDNAVQGSLITLEWKSTTNHSLISNGAVFQLTAAFTPVLGAILVLQATTTGTFAERYRFIPV